MIGLLCFAVAVLALAIKSKLRLEAENAVLRHQLNVLKRRLHRYVKFSDGVHLTGADYTFLASQMTAGLNAAVIRERSDLR
jgi:hypothetical protein